MQLMFMDGPSVPGIAGETIRKKTGTIPSVYFINEAGLELVVSR